MVACITLQGEEFRLLRSVHWIVLTFIEAVGNCDDDDDDWCMQRHVLQLSTSLQELLVIKFLYRREVSFWFGHLPSAVCCRHVSCWQLGLSSTVSSCFMHMHLVLITASQCHQRLCMYVANYAFSARNCIIMHRHWRTLIEGEVELRSRKCKLCGFC